MSIAEIATLERALESALMPGTFIDWRAKDGFLAGLEFVEAKIQMLAATDPTSGAVLFETFIASINAKMGEIDDDGDMGVVVDGLYVSWVKARQAGGASPTETIAKLAWWVEHDDYGLAFEIERGDVIKTLDASGLTALADTAQQKIAAAGAMTDERKGDIERRTWEPILRAVLVAGRNIGRYVAMAERDGVTPTDCETVADMLSAEGKHDDALVWVDRGMALEAKKQWSGRMTKGLGDRKRTLLMKLGRHQEALASAWAEYERNPWEHCYDDLMSYVPDGERPTWHARAMAVTDGTNLQTVAKLLIKCGETTRLASRVRATVDAELESMSHFTTEPIAGALEAEHPDLAARLHRACGMRVVNRGKSKYYDPALVNFEKARDCYLRAGMASAWADVVAEVRAAHSKKTGFMPRFERVVAGGTKAKEPSFLERARRKYGPAT
jgi:hypothetical protein